MDKRYRYIKKNRKKIFSILVLFIAIYLVIPFASAKYQYFYEAKSRIMTSDSFYFSVDLTGDSKMVCETAEAVSEDGQAGEEMQNLNLQESYQFAQKEERTWHLYGGADHTVSLQLRNYYDDLRITQAEIGYRASLSIQDVDGNELGTSLASMKTVNQDGTYQSSQGEDGSTGLSIEGTLGEGKQDKELILDIERYANNNYSDGTTVKLMIESTTPYKKVIELNFILHRADNYLSYEIKDFSGSAYAELIMRNHIPDKTSAGDQEDEGNLVQPYVSWPEELAIDNTNSLTYQSDIGVTSFAQSDIQKIENQGSMRRMQLSRPIKMNESCSIYFFKSDMKRDYTRETTIVNPSTDGNFEILIQGGNLQTRLFNINDSQIEGGVSETAFPYQEVAISSGRRYSGINGSDSVTPVAITNQSAFTLQFTTQYMPGKYENMREILQTSFHELYLWDGESTVATAIETNSGGSTDIQLQSVMEGNSPQSIERYRIEQRTAQRTAEDGGAAYYLISTKVEEEKNLSMESVGDSEADTVVKSTEDSGMDSIAEDDEKVMSLMSTASSEFTIPQGTVITMVAKINDYGPTYWYYYCTEDKTEISLSDFRQMNTIDTESTYNLSAASGNQVDANTEDWVREELRFVFDFGNTVSGMANTQVQEACAQLKHVATVDGVENVEIMDYVGQSAELDSNGNPVLYRSYPKTSNAWTISENSTDSQSFAIEMVDVGREYSVRDTYEIQVEIGEESGYEDTRCSEREYAVKLELVESDENGNISTRPFPEGMTMMYHDQQITASENNQVFILPVKSVGTHKFSLSTGLSAFCDGNNGTVTLRASLYASKDASYYNDLDLHKTASVSFNVKAEPEYALGVGDYRDVGEENNKHLFEKGETFSLGIRALKDGMPELEDVISVAIYQFDKQRQNYTRVDWSAVFANEENTAVKLSSDFAAWTGSISENAISGVYRLEFSYHDKIEYEDFIVK